jgi:uncharacterized damage-inducible protein DinB
MNAQKLLQHMAWANHEILTKVAELPDEALDAYVVNPEWTVREISRHIASSATWYGWRLIDKSKFTESQSAAWQRKLDLTEVQPHTSKDLLITIAYLKDADAELLAASKLPEGDVEREWNGEIIVRKRSTIISQAIHHATEHRAQLVAALETRGYTSINLDDYDLWNYADTIGE